MHTVAAKENKGCENGGSKREASLRNKIRIRTQVAAAEKESVDGRGEDATSSERPPQGLGLFF